MPNNNNPNNNNPNNRTTSRKKGIKRSANNMSTLLNLSNLISKEVPLHRRINSPRLGSKAQKKESNSISLARELALPPRINILPQIINRSRLPPRVPTKTAVQSTPLQKIYKNLRKSEGIAAPRGVNGLFGELSGLSIGKSGKNNGNNKSKK